jgi:hypothetical protein
MSFPFEDQRYQALLKLGARRFGSLNDSERDVLQLSASTDNSEPTDSGLRPEVRSEFLRWLATDKEAAQQIDPLGIRVRNATVSGPLSLSFCKIPFPLRFFSCILDHEVGFQSSELPFLSIEQCELYFGLNATEVRVTGDVELISSTAKGSVNLYGANIGGTLDCSRAILAPSAGNALFANTLKVGNLYLNHGFSATDAVFLVNSEISGDFDCLGADRFEALICDQMRVGQRMAYIAIAHPEHAMLFLYGARVGSFQDDERSWPQQGNLLLDGFVYQDLVAHKPPTAEQINADQYGDIAGLDVATRIRWLRLQASSTLDHAQPWMQLAKFVDSMGDSKGAKHVIYEYHRQRAETSFRRPFSFVYDQIVEDPLRVSWFIAGFWVVGALVFWRAQRMNAMRSTRAASNGSATPIPVAFNPAIYALENVLPVVKLGQDSAWEPDPAAEGTLIPNCWIFANLNRAAARWKFTRWLARLDYTRLAALRWLLILVGWALALILAAAIGQQFK